MAAQSVEKGLGSTIPLSSIAKLESTIDWIKFNREIRDYLEINGHGDLLGRHKKQPEKGNLTDDVYDTKVEAWLDKQERACAAVRNRCGYNAREEVKKETTVDSLLNKLKKRFRPTGSAVFQQLDRRYQELTLADCKNVMDFAEKLREARAELLELDKSCQIGEPHFVNKFLTGLGPAFDTFLTAFYQSHSLIPERNDAEVVTTEVDMTTL